MIRRTPSYKPCTPRAPRASGEHPEFEIEQNRTRPFAELAGGCYLWTKHDIFYPHYHGNTRERIINNAMLVRSRRDYTGSSKMTVKIGYGARVVTEIELLE